MSEKMCLSNKESATHLKASTWAALWRPSLCLCCNWLVFNCFQLFSTVFSTSFSYFFHCSSLVCFCTVKVAAHWPKWAHWLAKMDKCVCPIVCWQPIGDWWPNRTVKGHLLARLFPPTWPACVLLHNLLLSLSFSLA